LECDYGISMIAQHKLNNMKETIDIINIIIHNIPESVNQSLNALNTWQYSSRYVLLQVEPMFMYYLWFGMLAPSQEEVVIDLPACAWNDTYEVLFAQLAMRLIDTLEVDIVDLHDSGERLCLGDLENRQCIVGDDTEGGVTIEPIDRSTTVAAGVTCIVMGIVITGAILCVMSNNLRDTDWWSLQEQQQLHRNVSLPLLLSLKPRGWSAARISKGLHVVLVALLCTIALVSLAWFILFAFAMRILWMTLLFWIPCALVLILLLVLSLTLLQRCFPYWPTLLRIRQTFWVPVAWTFVYLVYWVVAFVIMELMWMIVGVVIHVNLGFPIFVAVGVITFCTWYSFNLATERARMAKTMIFDIFESAEGQEMRVRIPLTRYVFIRALESPRVAHGKLSLLRAWKRVATTMLLVLSYCIAIVSLLRFISDNSLVHASVTCVLLLVASYFPTLILQHDKSDFSNYKLRESLITYLRSLPQMQSDNLPITELLKDVQMDKSSPIMENSAILSHNEAQQSSRMSDKERLLGNQVDNV